MPLLDVRNLQIEFSSAAGVARAVDGVSFSVEENRIVCIVGESGCGKSITTRSIMRLVPSPPGRIAGGEILFESAAGAVDIAKLDENGDRMRAIRGNEIAMIFQEPMTSLNPAYAVGDQISEAIMLHQKCGRKIAWQGAIEALREVGIPAPEERVNQYPHQFSGGMRQRVMIAMALSCRPNILIADEPTTALDVTIQAQVLDLIMRLREENRMAVLFITHDLGVVAEIADDVLVMYLGKVVERGSVNDVLLSPGHPYTKGLLAALPSLTGANERLQPIEGSVPSAYDLPSGCRFASRCPHARLLCREQEPPSHTLSPSHAAACWIHSDFSPGKMSGSHETETAP
ncbi:ABC transporter ATP-binding protein [Martelella radicis]|uniref:Oligopeptide/dipeptide ABC transporter ATP-binding protein n=1 Tax=Martelella radicis TaxID=1397476 RepID=A0A7W6KNR4_9HYPH|nr:ABC transporter ATP-binding protein [Martelella radicis]MBB4124563.1 oligopeptide/dipeptide ABC transporter ATP-binding protein [Martelella radicis]